MTDSKKYNKHYIMLSSLFILGNACITAPTKIANEFSFLAFLLASVMAVAVYFIAFFIPINKITLIPIWLLAIYCILDAFITFIKFISSNLLPDSGRFMIIIPFVLILIYIAFKKTDTILKFSLLCGILVLAVIIFFFASTAKDFNVKNIFIYEAPRITTVYNQAVPFVKSFILPSILLALFTKQEKIQKGIGAGGLLLGLLLSGICILNSVLLFGIEFSAILDYPYSSAGSTVTFGYLFTRLDGFLYFVYLVTCTVKCAVGVFVIKKAKNKL